MVGGADALRHCSRHPRVLAGGRGRVLVLDRQGLSIAIMLTLTSRYALRSTGELCCILVLVHSLSLAKNEELFRKGCFDFVLWRCEKGKKKGGVGYDSSRQESKVERREREEKRREEKRREEKRARVGCVGVFDAVEAIAETEGVGYIWKWGSVRSGGVCCELGELSAKTTYQILCLAVGPKRVGWGGGRALILISHVPHRTRWAPKRLLGMWLNIVGASSFVGQGVSLIVSSRLAHFSIPMAVSSTVLISLVVSVMLVVVGFLNHLRYKTSLDFGSDDVRLNTLRNIKFPLLLFLLSTTLFFTVFVTFINIASDLMQHSGDFLSPVVASGLLSISTFIQVIARPYFGWFYDHHGAALTINFFTFCIMSLLYFCFLGNILSNLSSLSLSFLLSGLSLSIYLQLSGLSFFCLFSIFREHCLL